MTQITNRSQLDDAAKLVMAELSRIEDTFNNESQRYNQNGKIIQVTFARYITSIKETITALNENRETADSSKEITELTLERERLFYYNLELVLLALNEMSPNALIYNSKEMDLEANSIITALSLSMMVNKFMLESIKNDDHINPKEFSYLQRQLNTILENKMTQTNQKSQPIFETLRKVITLMTRIAFIKIAQLASQAGVDLRVLAKKNEIALEKEAAKKVQKHNIGITKEKLNSSETNHIKTNLFTAKRSREISRKISELKTASSSATPSVKKQ